MKKVVPISCTFLGLTSLLVYLLYGLGGRLILELFPLYRWSLLLLFTLGVSYGIGVGYAFLTRAYRWRNYLKTRWVLNLLLLTGGGFLMVYFACHQLEQWAEGEAFLKAEMKPLFLLEGGVVSLLLSLFIVWGDFSWYAYTKYVSETLAELQTSRKKKELQFQMLRSQLTPHYLFNSLNTASNLTGISSKQAEKFLRKLAGNFTYLLEHASEPLGTLERELEMMDNYFHLMEVRFGKKIFLSKFIEPSCLSKKLPALSLQLLVENALKHNVATLEKPVLITIKALNNHVLVQNNTTFAPQNVASKGVGLENLQARYSYLCSKNLSVFQSSDQFQVMLPYVTAQNEEKHV